MIKQLLLINKTFVKTTLKFINLKLSSFEINFDVQVIEMLFSIVVKTSNFQQIKLLKNNFKTRKIM